MNAYKTLVHNAIKDGYTVSVWDGEAWPVKRSVKANDIYEAIESVDEAQLRIRDKDGEYIGWALIVNGLADDELVADFTDTPVMNALCSVATA